MTELTIIPKISDKTARFKGTVAAGEHVAVTIKGGAEWLEEDNASHLMLRVIDITTRRTLAVFPRPPETLDEGEEEDEWEESQDDPTYLACNLNLNTNRMVAAARHMLHVPVLFVLGACDPENPETTRTLYFRDRYVVEYWPERVGDDTPYDLDKWPKKIDEWTELVDEWTAQLQRLKFAAVRTGDEPTEEVPYTTITLNKGVEGETDTVVKVYDGTNGEMTKAMTDARIALLAAPISHVDDTDLHLQSGERAAWTAKYNKPQGGIPASDLAGDIPKTALASAVQTSLGKADTALQASDITGKADKATTYTKAEVDAIVTALKTGSRQIVASLSDVTSPQPMVIYMVAKSESQTSNAYDEFIWVDVNGVGRWEKIGDTEIDLSNYVQKEAGKGLFSGDYADLTGKPTLEDAIARTSSNAVKSSGIWSAIWGTLTALPTGFTALYDWVVAQLTGKADKSEMSVTTANDTAIITLKQGTSVTVITQHQPLPAAVAPSTSAAQGAYADAHDTGTALATRAAASDLTALAQIVAGKLSTTGDTRTVTATDSGGTETYKFAGTGDADANTVARIKELPYADLGEAEEMLVGVYGIETRGVTRHTVASGETTATFGFAAAPTGRTIDALLDIDNSGNSSDFALEFYGLGTDFALVCDEDSDLAELTVVEKQTRARFFITQTAFVTSGGLPVLSIQRLSPGAFATTITRS